MCLRCGITDGKGATLYYGFLLRSPTESIVRILRRRTRTGSLKRGSRKRSGSKVERSDLFYNSNFSEGVKRRKIRREGLKRAPKDTARGRRVKSAPRPLRKRSIGLGSFNRACFLSLPVFVCQGKQHVALAFSEAVVR